MTNKSISLGLQDKGKLYNISKSLASKTRIDIVEQLNSTSMNVNEIAERLGIPTSTAAFNVNILEEAGIIKTELQPSSRGSMKLCSLNMNSIFIDLGSGSGTKSANTFYIDMPIGNYTDCRIFPTCGIVGSDGYLDVEDKPRGFYNAKKALAQLIWFYKGYLEYKFENNIIDGTKVSMLEISMELCSEAPFYRSEWPSDITMWINDVEIGTWTSPGDFGGRHGKLNPQWWADNRTQYGLLKAFRVTDEGSFADDQRISGVTLGMLNLEKGDFIKMRIGVRDDAHNVGGINIFGEKFGDYQQNIIMRIDYSM
jgi:predicted transcriptional regulator